MARTKESATSKTSHTNEVSINEGGDITSGDVTLTNEGHVENNDVSKLFVIISK